MKRFYIIKNDDDGMILKYQDKKNMKIRFNKPSDRVFNAYQFFKIDSVHEVIKRLYEQGFKNCSYIECNSEEDLKKYDFISKIKIENEINYTNNLNDIIKNTEKNKDFEPEYNKQCNACKRLCKISLNATFYGFCPRFTYLTK